MWSTSVEVCGCVVVLVVLVTRLVLRVGREAALQSAGTLRVMVMNEHSVIGREVCARLRAAGCVVNSVQEMSVDALVVAGGTREGPGLYSLVDLVTADLYHTIKEVEQSARRVRAGGRILWVATAAASEAVRDSFSGAVDAFDRVMRLQLEHIAHSARCEAVWLGRRCEAGRAVHSALLSPARSWTAVRRVRGGVGGGAGGAVRRWWKMST